MELKEYNKMQIQCIINRYKHKPNQEEILEWVRDFAKRYNEIIKEWKITTVKEIEDILYNNK